MPLDAPEEDPEPPPLTVSPTEPSTVAIVPLTGARSVVSESARRAWASEILACTTEAFADARSPGIGGAVLTALPAIVLFCCSLADVTCCSALCSDCVFLSVVDDTFAFADVTAFLSVASF